MPVAFSVEAAGMSCVKNTIKIGGSGMTLRTDTKDHEHLDDLPDFFSAAELLRVLPISRATVYRLSAQGEIHCLRIGKRVIFFRERLKVWANQNSLEGERE